uniref:Uncharacterized protein n=1 Tax=Ananas comosus var. bracteatus TaxID=296719 RepID=A0A6V7NJX3_ANACO|nr:unnamed protein product [Ananas comosus var. bracteatus]
MPALPSLRVAHQNRAEFYPEEGRVHARIPGQESPPFDDAYAGVSGPPTWYRPLEHHRPQPRHHHRPTRYRHRPHPPFFLRRWRSAAPAKWKGSCAFETGCNNKLIGAQSFVQDDKSPFDDIGHGTHTASTAAGNFVHGASAFGQASGTRAGVAPHAHLAMYKVCSASGCWTSDILAGLDAAVKDGVDVISISLGGGTDKFFRDVIAIGAFGAFEKGVFVSCAAGNEGPRGKSLSNEAPWYITVGATSVDRSFAASVQLYNNKQLYEGESLNQFKNFSSAPFELAYSSEFSSCSDFTGFDIRGKLSGGGIGVVLVNAKAAGYSIVTIATPADSAVECRCRPCHHRLHIAKPNACVNLLQRHRSRNSLCSLRRLFLFPRAELSKRDALEARRSGSGLNILAAWPTQADGGNDGKKTFNIISGTSMATPHVSGIAALIKSVHPDWSPAAVKSAVITTSDVKDKQGLPIFNELQTRRTRNVSCADEKQIAAEELNLPSIVFPIGLSPRPNVTRTVTNVGKAQSTYAVQLEVPVSVRVTVTPSTLSFSKVNEKKTFRVSVEIVGDLGGWNYGHLRLMLSECNLPRPSSMPASTSYRVGTSDAGESRLVHVYSEVFFDFAVKLTRSELKSMQKREEFVRAFPDWNLCLLTNHTPSFLGLRPGDVFLFIPSPVLSRPNIGVPSNASVNESEQLRIYIVRVQPPTEVADAGSTELESWYKSFLSESISDAGELRLVHSYSEVFVGFAAKLTKTELNSIQKKEGFVRAFPVKNLRLLTARTPAFLGLQPGTGLWNTTDLGRGTIIGLLDTGIARTYPYFSDDGVPPPPPSGRARAPSRPAATTSQLAHNHSCRTINPPSTMSGTELILLALLDKHVSM